MADSTHIEASLSKAEIMATVRQFVTATSDRALDDEENFFETGFVTSLFGMQLIAFLEETYPLVIEDEDLDVENFCSIERIARFVLRKLSSAS